MTTQHRVAVVGGGLMGAGIAQVFASAGFPTAVYDPSSPVRASLLDRVAAACAAAGQPTGAAFGRLTVHDELARAVDTATLVIEAGPERLDVKRGIFADIQAQVADDVIIASNTSSIPIGQIAAGLTKKERAIGIHFWNPPSIVRLAEVIRAEASEAVVAEVVGLLSGMGMNPVMVEADVPGFVGNRLQHALKREAIALVANGICTAETVDTVVRLGFGSRLGIVGPLEQSDLNGLELTLAIHEVVMPVLDVTPVPHPYLVALVESGKLGAKSGEGFYRWTQERAEHRRAEIAAALARRDGHEA